MTKRGERPTKLKKEDHQKMDDQRGGAASEGGRVHVKNTHEQRLKERSKSNFQTRNQTKLCD